MHNTGTLYSLTGVMKRIFPVVSVERLFKNELERSGNEKQVPYFLVHEQTIQLTFTIVSIEIYKGEKHITRMTLIS